jgi:hypothetical protein
MELNQSHKKNIEIIKECVTYDISIKTNMHAILENKTYSSRKLLMFPSDEGISPLNWLSPKSLEGKWKWN